MSEQQGFPEPFGDGDSPAGSPGDPDGPDGPRRRIRGRTIAIIVLAVLVLALIVAVVLLVFARGGSVTPTSSPTTAIATPTHTATPTRTATPAPPSTPGAVSTCSVDDLAVSLGTGNAAAGSAYVPIRFTNTSSKPCELHGFPGVSFVGKGNGTQLGAPADWDQSQPIVQNTLRPGDVVVANLRVAQAGNYDSSECQPLAADGFRVYPPHSTRSVFVQAANLTACQNDKVHLLTVVSPVAAPK